ncbi:MAG: phage terminase large subunit [Candidatus Adiutrix sp.]|jgi:predicted phage terminase large subunit-like protein|nr:phage terminase large subunit [Candidatus Adiutrix sp.]
MIETEIIQPQPGPQSAFLSSPADIALYGGAAGGGKTWALLAEPLRHVASGEFRAVIFRRNAVQVRIPGGLWDEAAKMYPALGGVPQNQNLEWRFPSGARIKFAHLEHDDTALNWQGSQAPLICFDELTHFTEKQFFYLLSRNRGLCGVKPYVRATCNPDADSWVARFIAWWIDRDSGRPAPGRSGQLRWMSRRDDRLLWADQPEDLEKQFQDSRPKSITFIASSLFDNRILMEADPGYLANLKALPRVERERLLDGNWKIRPAAGLFFRQSWCRVAEAAPAGLVTVRYWDLAATEKTPANDPDFTVSVKMGRDPEGRLYILHCESFRRSPHQVKEAIRNLAEQDGPAVIIGLPRDPGQAGKAQARDLAAMLAGRSVRIRAESGDKVTRFNPFSAQCEAGNVTFVRGPWNDELFEQLEAFPEAAHDDHADACSGAYTLLAESRRLSGAGSQYVSVL